MMRRDAGMPGRVFGVAGGGLNNASWAANADVAAHGKVGEEQTAAILNELAARPGGATVLHDLRIPIPGFSANIDHVVVAGDRVLLVDSKRWKPGFYWTFGGKSRRGLARVPHVDKKTMQMASEHIGRFLAKAGVRADVQMPVVVVWPSSRAGSTSLWAAAVPGARLVRADRFGGLVRRFMKPGAGTVADAAVVARLSELLPAGRHGTAHPARSGRGGWS